MNEESVTRLRSHLKNRRLAVLAGAGVSAAAPSCAPLFRPLRNHVLQSFVTAVRSLLPQAVAESASRLFETRTWQREEPVPEVLFEALHGVLEEDLFAILRMELGVEAPNFVHRTLAERLGHEIRLLITTNFDEGFELAVAGSGRGIRVCDDTASIASDAARMEWNEPTIWKPHGTLASGREQTIRVTLEQVAKEIQEEQKIEAFRRVVDRHPLLVIGYSGYDHDLAYVLRSAAATGLELFWLSWKQPADDEPSLSISKAWGDRGHLLIGDVSAFLATLFEIAPNPPAPADACAGRRHEQEGKAEAFIAGLSTDKCLFAVEALAHQMSRYDLAQELEPIIDSVVPPNHPLRIATLLPRIEAMLKQQRVADARAALAEASAAPNEIRNRLMAVLLHEEGHIHRAVGDYARAADAFDRAIAIADASHASADLRLNILQSRGALYGSMRHFADAARLHEYVRREAIRNGFRVLAAKAAFELAINTIEEGDLDRAMTELGAVEQEAQLLGHFDIAHAALHEMAIIEKQRGRFAEARELVSRAITAAETIKAATLVLMSKATAADIAFYETLETRDASRFAGVAEQYAEVIAAARTARNREVESSAVSGRGRCRALLGDFDGATEDLETLKRLAKTEAVAADDVAGLQQIIAALRERAAR